MGQDDTECRIINVTLHTAQKYVKHEYLTL